jgi:mannitol-specific phosphotransferase system IIBC component
MVLRMHLEKSAASYARPSPGAILRIVYSAENQGYKRTPRAAALLPLLVVLFIVSYGILTMLVFEQGQTIESQRGLIREMLKDSTQLASIKSKISRDDSPRPKDGQPDAATLSAPQAQPKGSEAKGVDVDKDKESKKSGKTAHSMKQIPGKPAADLQDVRRLTRVI